MTEPADYLSLLAKGGIKPKGDSGLTDEEIVAVESAVGQPLPKSYRDFLRAIGRGAGELFEGTDMYYPNVLELREWLREMEADEEYTVLEETDVVIAMHQGYIVYFLRGEGENPAVYAWREKEREPKWVAQSLLRFISDELERMRDQN